MLRYCRQRFELQFEILSGPHDTGPRKSETLHDTPPGPPESHYLLSSPGKPVSLRDSLKIPAYATNSVVWCFAAFMLYPAISCCSREPHVRCAIGAIPILQISRVAGKASRTAANLSLFNVWPRMRMSIAAMTRNMQARRLTVVTFETPESVKLLI